MLKNAIAYTFGALVAISLAVLVVRGDRLGEQPGLASEGTSSGGITEPVEETDLPGPVVAAMRSHPRAIYVSGVKVTRGEAVEYHLTLRGTRKTAMIARPDGTVVSFK